MTKLMTKLFITDIRGKVNDLDGILFVVIVLFRRGDVMNKIPQQETDKCRDHKTGLVVHWVGHKCTTPLKKQHLSIEVQSEANVPS